MQIGLYTFGDLVADPASGIPPSPLRRMRELLELARRADAAGLDILGVGEHHSARFVASSTATIIAAMAAVTTRIRLTSATTLLGTADPVRTFEEFATVDLISGGRAEMIVGRGAFSDHLALFGVDPSDYDVSFTEKLALLSTLNAAPRVTWSGRFRPALRDADPSPRPAQAALPIWVGAGSRATVTRVAALGYPLVLPMIGGTIAEHAELASLYRKVWVESGRSAESCRIAVATHLHVGESPHQVRREFHPSYLAYLRLVLRRPISPAQLEQLASPEGVLVAGTPQEVTQKLHELERALGAVRYLGQMDLGGQRFERVARSLDLYASEVALALRREAST